MIVMRKRIHVEVLVMLVIVCVGCMNQDQQPEIPTEKPPEQPPEDQPTATHYKIRVKPSLEDHKIIAEAEVTVRVPANLSELTFCLGGDLKISEITEETGAPLSFGGYGGIIHVNIPPLSQSIQKRLTFDYEAFIYTRRDGFTEDYVGEEACWVKSESGWYPTLIVNPDAGCYIWERIHWEDATLIMEVPESWTVICAGELTSQSEVGGMRTWVFEAEDVHGLDFAAGEFEVTAQPWDEKEITCYLTRHTEHAQKYIDISRQILEFYSEKFGEYPFSQFSLVELPEEAGIKGKPYVGGRPGYVMMDLSSFDREEKEFVRELSWAVAYEWWAHTVAADDLESYILHLCFSDYASLLFMRELYGEDIFCEYLVEFRQEIETTFAAYGSKSIKDYGRFRVSDVIDNAVRLKAVLMLHCLKEEVGDDTFFEVLTGFIEQNKKSHVSVDDLLNAFEEISGQDVSMFFEKYYYSSDIPPVEECKVAHLVPW